MNIKVHDFKVSGGEKVENGKSNWPDCLNIVLPKHRALSLIQQLANSLEVYRDAEQEFILLNFMGKLDYDVDENA